MYDKSIRTAFHSTILKKNHRDAKVMVVDELGIDHGKRRADIAVLASKLEGYEIKGEFDTLERLSEQVKAYNSIFSKCSLVVYQNHMNKCLEQLPTWWGIYEAFYTHSGDIKFKQVRKADKNPEAEAFSMAKLLWKNEAQQLVQQYATDIYSPRLTKTELYSIIADHVPLQKLEKIIAATLKSRSSWRAPLQSL